MRSFPACLTLGFALLAAGCHLGPHVRPDNAQPTQTTASQPLPVEELLKYLNDNSSRVTGVQSNKVSIDASQDGQSIALAGNLACQKPKGFRLKASVVGQSAADIGSNDQE